MRGDSFAVERRSDLPMCTKKRSGVNQ
jgi:hypothetical protein